MIITPETIRNFHQKNIYYRALVPSSQLVPTLAVVDRCNLSMKVTGIGPTILTCSVPTIAEPGAVETIKLAMKNMGRKWLLMSEYGENPSNIDRTTCFRCGCPTEMQRDFLSFTVRLFCPRCHI
jgi:hypothetical protein